MNVSSVSPIPLLHLGVVSLLPEMFLSLEYGVTGRAIRQGLVKVDIWNPRDWGLGTHKKVDDKPYGGGPGMVMCYEPLHAAIQHAQKSMEHSCKTVLLSPQGTMVSQAMLQEVINAKQPLLLIAGRYEGIDQRLIEEVVTEEWSVGDFVLSGGELAAMVFMDALIRLLPGALGGEESAQQDSFMNGLLEAPHYTRPAVVQGKSVPAILLQGNHQEIARFRRKQALGVTWLKKPALLDRVTLSVVDKALLAEFIREHVKNTR